MRVGTGLAWHNHDDPDEADHHGNQFNVANFRAMETASEDGRNERISRENDSESSDRDVKETLHLADEADDWDDHAQNHQGRPDPSQIWYQPCAHAVRQDELEEEHWDGS